jgi:hypothetical protein
MRQMSVLKSNTIDTEYFEEYIKITYVCSVCFLYYFHEFLIVYSTIISFSSRIIKEGTSSERKENQRIAGNERRTEA